MIHEQFDEYLKNYAIASIHIYNMKAVPFNRGLVPAQVSDPYMKLEIIKTAINAFMTFDPGIPLEFFIVVNSGTDCEMTQKYYDSIDGTVTKWGTIIRVLDAPDSEYPGPYGARMFVYREFPYRKYYFDCDNDCMPMMDGWFAEGIRRLNLDPTIGLLGANISEKPYQCKDNIIWYDWTGQPTPAPCIKYPSGFWTFIPGHIYALFDYYWGKDWFSQGNCYYDWTASQGELGFAFKVLQLGYKVADFVDDETDAFYSYIVPDSLFPNKTIGNVDEYPSKPRLCPFYHAQLKILKPQKWQWLRKYISGKFFYVQK